MKKDCTTCHWGHEPGGASRCFEGVNCFAKREHPNWTPETNGDRVRKMTDEQLRDLWGKLEFDPEYIPDGCGDTTDCEWPDFHCRACPETFFNWLQAEAENENHDN